MRSSMGRDPNLEFPGALDLHSWTRSFMGICKMEFVLRYVLLLYIHDVWILKRSGRSGEVLARMTLRSRIPWGSVRNFVLFTTLNSYDLGFFWIWGVPWWFAQAGFLLIMRSWCRNTSCGEPEFLKFQDLPEFHAEVHGWRTQGAPWACLRRSMRKVACLSVSPKTGWWWLEHFLFCHVFGGIVPIDFHIFQRGRNHSPDKVVL